MGSRILVITPDVLSARMAGPAIRAWNIAAALQADGQGHEVSLVSTDRCDIDEAKFDVRYVAARDLGQLAKDYDVLVVQGFVTYHCRELLSLGKILIVDWYDPLHLEQLEQLRDLDERMRRTTIDLTVRMLNEQAAHGEFFLCANEAQRALWTGFLSAMGRVNPLVYDVDPSLDGLIAIVPFGLSDEPPHPTIPGPRESIASIGPDDELVLWAGGIYNWFDPLTLIEAVARLAVRRPRLRLLFMGMVHPSADPAVLSMAQRARRLSDELGLTGRHVFFNEQWVPYRDRASYLLDADIGVSTHLVHAETRYSFRTRMLDYLWAGLPIVCTEGDGFAERVAQRDLGRVVPQRDVDALVTALDDLLGDPEGRAAMGRRVSAEAETMTWSEALRPLVEFCRIPRPAADSVIDRRRVLRQSVPPSTPVHRAVMRARELAAEGGLPLLRRRAGAYARRRLGR